MVESHLRGKGLYCCFREIKTTFDMLPHEHLSKKMEELEVPSEYMLAISQIYEKVISCVFMDDRLSEIALFMLSKDGHLTDSIRFMH